MRRAAALVALGGVLLAAVRPGLLVRAIRFVDRRLELFSPNGARAYARFAPAALAGLYGRVVDDAATLAPDGLIADLGSGPGDLTRQLAARLPGAKVIGIDPSAAMCEIAVRQAGDEQLAGRVTYLDGTAERLPLGDAALDLLVSTVSAHHWADLPAALAEISRVLRPGGEARIYDVRFGTYTSHELERAAAAALDPGRISREVVDLRVGPFRPFALIRLAPAPPIADAAHAATAR